jgi:anion-transporting  ArsA/GET3 family ATPase
MAGAAGPQVASPRLVTPSGLSQLLSRRLLVVAGKGGVGKTTVSAVLALLAASRGKRVLLMLAGSAVPLGRMLESAPVGPEIAELLPNLHAVHLEPGAALEEYALGVLRSRLLYRLVFDNLRVRAFLGALPGLPELLVIGKVRHHVEDVQRGREPDWDLVVLDTPPTGAGVFLLSLPQALLEVLERGPIAQYARRQRDLLRDPARTSVHIVTLAEEMAVRESIDLTRQIRERLRFPLGCLFVNQVRPPLFNAREQEDVQRLARLARANDPPLGALLEAARWELGRQRVQDEHLARLRHELPGPRVELSHLGHEPTRRDLERFAQKTAHQLG